ncbi:MAG: KEOPS complex subunit Cgi121 [Candidatus Methanospirareceae archaeon]
MHLENARKAQYRILVGSVSISSVSEFLAALKAIAEQHAVTVQALDTDLVVSEAHLHSAVEKALRAVKKGRNITSDLGMEILVYAAGKRQIGRALAMGVTEGEKRIACIIVATTAETDLNAVVAAIKASTGLSEEQNALQTSELVYDVSKRARVKRFFGITDRELSAVGEAKLPQLVLERVALLDVLK